MIKIVDKKKVRLEVDPSAYQLTDEDHDFNHAQLCNNSQITLPDIQQTTNTQKSYPDFLSGIYVEETTGEQSKYALGETVNTE
jgi:hypothetical protein